MEYGDDDEGEGDDSEAEEAVPIAAGCGADIMLLIFSMRIDLVGAPLPDMPCHWLLCDNKTTQSAADVKRLIEQVSQLVGPVAGGMWPPRGRETWLKHNN